MLKWVKSKDHKLMFKNLFYSTLYTLVIKTEKNIIGDLSYSIHTREVVDLRNVGKFLQKFFENQRIFQFLIVKSTKISEKNLDIWTFCEFFENWKIFVNKNTIKMKNIWVLPPYQRLFSVTFFSDFLKFLKSSWSNENPDYPLMNSLVL